MFADDTTLLNKTEDSIEETCKVLRSYEKVSGSRINANTTIGLYIGRWKNKEPEYKGISWTKGNVKTLGVHHGYNIDDDRIWREKINKIHSCIEVWKSRDLLFRGSTFIVKSCIISIIEYKFVK